MSVERRTIPPAVLSVVVAFAVAIAPAPSGAVDFLVPGMSLESVSLIPGARVSYLVTSESFGAVDSSYVEIRVLSRKGRAHRIEIVSSPYPRSREGSVTVRLRLSEGVTSVTSVQAFRDCLEEILIREGAAAFRAPTEREIEDLDLEELFVRPDAYTARTELAPARIVTPAGTFLCEGVELSRKETRIVNLGGVRAERSDEETSRTWRSRDVPLWGLVMSTVEKKSLTKVEGGRAFEEHPRVTKTESILLSSKKPRNRP